MWLQRMALFGILTAAYFWWQAQALAAENDGFSPAVSNPNISDSAKTYVLYTQLAAWITALSSGLAILTATLHWKKNRDS